MWLFRGLSIGFYNPIFLLFHIPIWCTGYLIRDKTKSPTARWIWLFTFTAAIILGEIACSCWLEGNDRWIPVILLTMLLDLIIGFFSKGVSTIIRRSFTFLLDWIRKDET